MTDQSAEPLSDAAITKLRRALARLKSKSGYLTGSEQMNERLLATLDAERATRESSPLASPGADDCSGLDASELAAREAIYDALTFDPDVAPQPSGPIVRKWWRLGWLSALAVARDRIMLHEPTTRSDEIELRRLLIRARDSILLELRHQAYDRSPTPTSLLLEIDAVLGINDHLRYSEQPLDLNETSET